MLSFSILTPPNVRRNVTFEMEIWNTEEDTMNENTAMNLDIYYLKFLLIDKINVDVRTGVLWKPTEVESVE